MFVPSTSARMQFDSLQSVHDRLAGTYVFYRDNFYYVQDVREVNPKDFQINLVDVGNVSLSNLDLHYQGFNIGFVRTSKGPYFVSRGGFRQYKQGLSDANLIVRPLLPDIQSMAYASLRLQEFRKGVAEAVMNLYPSFTEVIEKNRSGAFSKYFARFKDNLYYKTNKVGTIVDGTAKLDEGYEYLKESLEEAIRGT